MAVLSGRWNHQKQEDNGDVHGRWMSRLHDLNTPDPLPPPPPPTSMSPPFTGPGGPYNTASSSNSGDSDDHSEDHSVSFAFTETWKASWPTNVAKPSTLATSITPTNSAWPDAHPSSSFTLFVPNDSSSPTPAVTGSTNDNEPPGLQQHSSSNAPIYAAGAIIPVIIVAAIGLFLFLRARKRKTQTMPAAAKTQEMKTRNSPRVSAYMAPPLMREPSYTQPPRHPPPQSPQPVILGPISGGANGNYFTGLDTSDVVSVRDTNERTGLGDPFADGSSLLEEPPPPYRPRSLAALSRDSSLRSQHNALPAVSSRTRLVDDQGLPLQSPFDDPRNEDDDTVSELAGPVMRGATDDMSAVSDLSYQHDPFADSRRS